MREAEARRKGELARNRNPVSVFFFFVGHLPSVPLARNTSPVNGGGKIARTAWRLVLRRAAP
jgi:hypothetical protein